jgi:hydroxypyruvate isomerase
MNSPQDTPAVSRRNLLRGAVSASAGATLLSTNAFAADAAKPAAQKIVNGRLKQSVVFWCFNVAGDKWDAEKTCQVANELGCKSVELIGPEDWGTLKKHGLVCAIAPNGMPGAPFMKGLNNLKYHDEVITRTSEMMQKCAEAKFPSVIAFNGFKFNNAEDPNSSEISLDEGAKNCIAGLKKLATLGEKLGVTVCLEHLNSRDGSHPMKGHPGYQGDNMDYVADIVKKVGSPRVKILFDVYHVQIMNGDVMRRIDQYHELIGHVHTAGCPGRGELDDKQEINYPPIMRKLVEVKYQGYVGQEFIPTRDALTGLREAVVLCDV